MNRRRSRRSEERRQRLLIGLVKLLVVVGAFAFTAYYAYEVGFRVAQRETGSLRENLEKAEINLKEEQAKVEADHYALDEAKKQADDFKSLYDQVKPTDDIRDLTAIMRSKLASGMNPRRLAFVIKSAQNPHDCEGLGTKRFLVRTPRYKGPEATTMVRFDDVVTITADGAGGNGGHEQWFDPESPVKVHVAAAGAKDAELGGNLPVEYAVAVRNSEYHFTISAANARGWVEVVTERCNFR